MGINTNNHPRHHGKVPSWVSTGYLLDIYSRHCSTLHQMLFKSSGDTGSALPCTIFIFVCCVPCAGCGAVLLGGRGHIWRYLSINQGCYITGPHLLLRPQPPAQTHFGNITLGSWLWRNPEYKPDKPSSVGCR